MEGNDNDGKVRCGRAQQREEVGPCAQSLEVASLFEMENTTNDNCDRSPNLATNTVYRTEKSGQIHEAAHMIYCSTERFRDS